MGTTTCATNCGTTTRNAICTTCLDRLDHLLHDVADTLIPGPTGPRADLNGRHGPIGPDRRIPGLETSLHVAAAKQSRFTSTSSRVITSRGKTQPLPVNLRATDTRHQLHRTLARWAGHIAEAAHLPKPPSTSTAAAIAAWISQHRDWLAGQTATATLLADVTRVHATATRVIDRPADRAYAGRCHTLDCPGLMYAYDGAPEAICATCQATTGYEDARRAMLAKVDDLILPAPEIELALRGLGQEVKATTIRKWCERGRLANRGTPSCPRYRVGDALNLAWNSRPRAGVVPSVLVSQ